MKTADAAKLEEREQTGYELKPDTLDEWDIWEREAAWPEETNSLESPGVQ